MRFPHLRKSGFFAAALWFAVGMASAAQDGAKPKPSNDSEIARYCSNIAPSAAEARLTFQLAKLSELDARVREALAALDRREQETQEWVLKRDALTKAANEDLVAIYTKMSAEAAAAQIDDMGDTVAASLLSKLKPQAAAAILNEMDPEKASHLTTMIAGPLAGADKS
jgi:flagellar motility protein MotE (MotC chaperone)